MDQKFKQELESLLLAHIIQDEGAKILPSCMSMGVTAEMFTDTHGKIWSHTIACFKETGEVDEIAICQSIDKNLVSEIIHLSAKTVASQWKHLAKSVIENYIRANATRAAMYIQDEIEQGEPDQVISRAIQMLEDKPTSDESETSTSKTMTGLQDRVKQRKAQGSIVKTAISSIDEVVKIHGGQLITVAARPGGGKSTGLIQMAFESACYHKASVDLYTLEMATDEVLTKGLAYVSGVSMNKIGCEFKIPQDLQDKLDRAGSRIAEANLHIYDDPDATTDMILARSKQRQATTGLDAIFVDYVQILNPSDPKAPRVEQVSQMTRDLKKIAKRLNVPVIVAAQLNRDVAKAGRKPKLSDLRESGSIEQDSDIVIMIHPKKEVEEDPSAAYEVEVDLMVEKHRNGATFHAPATFKKTESKFHNRAVGGM